MLLFTVNLQEYLAYKLNLNTGMHTLEKTVYTIQDFQASEVSPQIKEVLYIGLETCIWEISVFGKNTEVLSGHKKIVVGGPQPQYC